MHRDGDIAKLHDVGCQITHNARCEAVLKGQREVVVPMLATEKLTEPQFDVDAWEHTGLPHIRLDFMVVDGESFTTSLSCEKAREGAGRSTSTADEGEQVPTRERRLGSYWRLPTTARMGQTPEHGA